MIERDLELRLTAWLRDFDDEVPSATLRTRVDSIPDRAPVGRLTLARGSRRGRLIVLGLAAAIGLLGAAIVNVGSDRTDDSTTETSSPAASPLPASEGPIATSGVVNTPIGRLSWSRGQGSFPEGEPTPSYGWWWGIPTVPAIIKVPDGYAAFGPSTAANPGSVGLWRSSDGSTWSWTPLPFVGPTPSGAYRYGFGARSGATYWVGLREDDASGRAGTRLWRSTNLATWTEIDPWSLSVALTPPVDPAMDWHGYDLWDPVDAGGVTVFSSEARFSIRLAELLSLSLGPNDNLELTPGEADEQWIVSVRTASSADSPNATPIPPIVVGRVRFEPTEATVSIVDPDRNTILAEIDPPYGLTAEQLIQRLEQDSGHSSFSLGRPIAVAATGETYPIPELADAGRLFAVGSRLVSGLPSGRPFDPYPTARVTSWETDDGRTWTKREPVGLPDEPLDIEVIPRPQGESGSLSAIVTRSGSRDREFWTTTDGLEWRRIATLTGYPEPWLWPVQLASGGFVGSDALSRRLFVSPTGEHWTPVEGPPEILATSPLLPTSDAIFVREGAPADAPSAFWVLRFGP